uniref:Uncharacterized protein n=1 Tax=Physcomitrium patens TaxID=3218 RepID=A0A2K1KUV4_PHYPA|nr:hypothetical protein PHYPA_004524 [Physcomitrium patens]
MQDSHFSEMRWDSEISTAAFCDSLDLRRHILQKRQSFGRGKRRPPLLEPASAEFISALAAGINSRHTLQVGCGLSTLALAAGLEFVLFSGQPEQYIELFDLLKLKKGAIVVADNALDDATNDYIRHVRRQPGVESSTLPLSRGIEVTKIVTWGAFNRGRKKFDGIEELMSDKGYMRRLDLQNVTVSRSHSSPRFSAHSEDFPTHSSDFDAEDDHIHSEPSEPEMVESGTAHKMNTDGLDESECETPTGQDSDKLERSKHGEVRRASSGLIHVETLLRNINNELSVVSPHLEASGDLELGIPHKVFDVQDFATRLHSWHLLMDLENNGASLPSSDASIADRVAPEPLDSAGDVLAVEDISFVLEEPAFQVHFQNDNGQTQVTVEGDDQDQFLFDLTHAFKETVVSVKKARISTQESRVLDVFHVVDGRTKGPLSASREDEVRNRILDRLKERRGKLKDR